MMSDCMCQVVCVQCETIPLSLLKMVQHVTRLHGGAEMTEEDAASLTAALMAPINYCFGGSHQPRRRWEDFTQGEFDGSD